VSPKPPGATPVPLLKFVVSVVASPSLALLQLIKVINAKATKYPFFIFSFLDIVVPHFNYSAKAVLPVSITRRKKMYVQVDIFGE
jgi:hypothetical protein